MENEIQKNDEKINWRRYYKIPNSIYDTTNLKIQDKVKALMDIINSEGVNACYLRSYKHRDRLPSTGEFDIYKYLTKQIEADTKVEFKVKGDKKELLTILDTLGNSNARCWVMCRKRQIYGVEKILVPNIHEKKPITAYISFEESIPTSEKDRYLTHNLIIIGPTEKCKQAFEMLSRGKLWEISEKGDEIIGSIIPYLAEELPTKTLVQQ